MVRVVEDGDTSWLTQYVIQFQEEYGMTRVWSNYLVSLYWSVATLSSSPRAPHAPRGYTLCGAQARFIEEIGKKTK